MLSPEETAAKQELLEAMRIWWRSADQVEAGRTYHTLVYVLNHILAPLSQGEPLPDDTYRWLLRRWHNYYGVSSFQRERSKGDARP